MFLLLLADEKRPNRTRRHRAIRLLADVLVFGSLIYILVHYFSLSVNFQQMKIDTSVGKWLIKRQIRIFFHCTH